MTAPTDTDPAHPRLGRRFVGHDARNLDHLARPLMDARGLVHEDRFWPMPATPAGQFPLDQGQSPECTGFGSSHELALGPVQVGGIDAAYAHARYARNVAVDRAAGRNFDGGATVGATMTAAKQDNLVTGYKWNLGVADTADAVASAGPVCLGTDWRDGMFTPTGGQLQATGASVGGHFWVLAARVWAHPTWGPGFWMVNSWGRWGVGVPQLGLTTGCAYVTDDTLGVLLADSGESVIMADFLAGPVPPVPPDARTAPFYARAGTALFHDVHTGVRRDIGFAHYADAVALGYKPCRVCRPQRDG